MGGQRHTLASLTPGMTWYPLYRRLGGSHGRSGQVRKISPPPGFDPQTVQAVASRYTTWAIPAHIVEYWTGRKSFVFTKVYINPLSNISLAFPCQYYSVNAPHSLIHLPLTLHIFHWHKPSDRTMALGSTQPLTEMSTRNLTSIGPAVNRNIIPIVKRTRCASVSNLFYIGMTLYMFRAVFPSIIRSLRLYIQQQNRYCCLLASGYDMELQFYLVPASKQTAVSVR